MATETHFTSQTAQSSGPGSSTQSSPRFLQQAWYPAGFTSELEAGLVERTILNQPVLMYRDQDGQAVAIGNRCPHRSAPLSMGKLSDGVVTCGYHGLGFDRTGRCVRNPHGGGVSTQALSVPSYSLCERDGLLWIWMGMQDQADETQLPDYDCLDGSRFFIGTGYLHGQANYELMTDNILDLSHIEFLHPGLGTEAVSRAKVEVEFQGGRLVTTRRMRDEVLPSNLAHVYQTGTQRVNRTMEVSWQAPANMLLRVIIEPLEAGAVERGSQTLHLFTPETAYTTHYFYVGAMRKTAATQDLCETFLKALGRAFVNEDKAMIDAQQRMLGVVDIMDTKPALLPIDKAAVLARRELRRLIAEDPKNMAGHGA